MTKKYELTSKTREINFVDMNGKRACATLYRIRALKPIHFSNGGNIKAGEMGGYVQSEENLSQKDNSWISGKAVAMENARVKDNARISFYTRVQGNAILQDNAKALHHSIICDNAIIKDNAIVSSNGVIKGNAVISNFAQVKNGLVCGNAKVCDNAVISTNNYVNGNALVRGNTRITGNTIAEENAVLDGNVITVGSSIVGGNTYINGDIIISCHCRMKSEETIIYNNETPIVLSSTDDYCCKKIDDVWVTFFRVKNSIHYCIPKGVSILNDETMEKIKKVQMKMLQV